MATHEVLTAAGPGENLQVFYNDFLESLEPRNDIIIESYPLIHRAGTYGFLKIKSSEVSPDDKVILIRATIHGEETAGAYGLLHDLNEIIDYAHERGIKLIVYPLGNPSGFEKGTSFNVDRDPGDNGITNNDFLRYELPAGQIVKDIRGGRIIKRWYWSSEPRLNIRLAAETKLMHELLRKDPLVQIVASLDLHQDYISSEQSPAAYAYAYDDLGLYKPIVERIAKIVPVWRSKLIGAGYEEGEQSDENGIVLRYDGSLPDLLRRLGSRHNITPETTGGTDLKVAMEVNRLWTLGIINLVHSGY